MTTDPIEQLLTRQLADATATARAALHAAKSAQHTRAEAEQRLTEYRDSVAGTSPALVLADRALAARRLDAAIADAYRSAS